MSSAPSWSAGDIWLERGGHRDLDQLVSIMEQSFAACFGEAWTRSQCAGILPMTGVDLVLAGRGDGDPQGFALSRIIADEAELLLLAVRRDAQRGGLGQALLDRFVAHARDQGVHRLHLEVRDGNPAVALYQRNGFAPAGRRRDYYHGRDGSAHDALTLVRIL